MNNSSDHKKFTISIVFFLSLSLSACEFSQKGGSNKDIIESQTPMPNGASETVSLLIPSTKGEQIEKTIGIDIRSDDNALERLLKGKFRNAI